MIRFAMCNEFCQGWEIERVFDLAAETGYHGVEIAPFTLADSVTAISAARRREIRSAAAKRGLAIAGLHWLLVKPEGLYINHPNDEIRAKTGQYMSALIDFCADLGSDRMIVGSPKQRNIIASETRDTVWARTVDVFRGLAEKAVSRGVILCIEPLSPAETNFINTAAEAVEMVKAVGSPGFQLMLDVKAMASEGRPIADIIREAAPWVRHFHANDPNLLGPGFGAMDFGPIVEALREVGYDEWVSVEVFNFEPGARVIATRSREYLRRVFGH